MIKQPDPESLDIIKDILLCNCLDGQCYELAIAISRGTGLQMVGLWDAGYRRDNGDMGAWRHAAIELADGRFLDARGIVTAEELWSPFGMTGHPVQKIEEHDLVACRPVPNERIGTIAKLAQAVWPDLPWQANSYHKRMTAFLDDLEALSRRHGVWIRSPYATAKPVLAEGDEDEVGYQATMTDDGLAINFDRSYEPRHEPDVDDSEITYRHP